MNSSNIYSEIDFDSNSDYAYDAAAGGNDIMVESLTNNSELSMQLALLTAVLGVPANAMGDQTTCVATAAQLQTALTNAANNGMIDVIKLVQGTYTGNFVYSSNENYGLTIQGGFNPGSGCASRVLNPANTVLNGNQNATTLVIATNNGNLKVEGVTLRDGRSTSNGGGLAITGFNNGTHNNGSVTLANNSFISNTAYGGGAYINSYSPTIVTDNVFNGNISNGVGGGIHTAYGGTIDSNEFIGNIATHGGGAYGYNALTNNTFRDNLANGYFGKGGGAITSSHTVLNNSFYHNNAAYGGGLYLSLPGDEMQTDITLANNLLWANTTSTGQGGADIYIANDSDGDNNPTPLRLTANDFDQTRPSGFYSPVNIAIPAGNLNRVNPLFVASDNLHLSANSPVINKGDKTVAGLPTTDMDGGPRIVGTNVDIGADEYPISNISKPIATTNPSTAIAATSATLNGNVTSAGATATASFDFGPTTTYGTSIAATPAQVYSSTAVAVTANKTGLICGTTYHVRTKAISSAGTGLGTDKAFTTAACPPVDFVITDVVLTPPSPTATGTFSAAITIKNQSAAAGDGGQLRVWANQSAAQVCAATGGDKTIAVGTIAAGASKVINVTGLASGAVGTKKLRAFVDATCVRAESNEINNQWAKTYRVTNTQAADFVVTAINLDPVTPSANGAFSVSVTVKNQGSLTGNGGFLDVWSNLPTAPICGSEGNAWANVGVLVAGASKTLTLYVPSGVAGAKTARAYIDSWCEFAESNETNNQMIKSYTVQ